MRTNLEAGSAATNFHFSIFSAPVVGMCDFFHNAFDVDDTSLLT